MGNKILVVDDDNEILEILALLLAEKGYRVKTLTRAEKLFEHIKAFKPDLLLLDIMLVGLDGRRICKDIKLNRLTSFLPVILISGTCDLKVPLNLPGAPNDFLAKPFNIDQLLERIEIQLAA